MSRIRTPLAVTLAVAGLALTGCAATVTPRTTVPVVPERGPALERTAAHPKPKPVTSDVSQLRRLGIGLDQGVLIDVADDGRNRYLAVGRGGRVDFTGTGRTDDTMMSLRAAKVSTKSLRNRVVIVPPFYHEDRGRGYCVADVARAELRLATCVTGRANQTWRVVPGGDSGQFELHGRHTKIRVDQGRITRGGRGFVGLQTIPFAR